MPGKISLYRKLVVQDPQNSSDEDLLAVLLSGATGKTEPRHVARSLLAHAADNLIGIDKISEFEQIPGLTGPGYARIVAAVELCKRAMRRPKHESMSITSAELAYEVFISLGLEPEENFAVLYLNRRHNLIGKRILTRGNMEHTIVDPRQILRPAIAMGAACIIMAHNHPSGDPAPSQADIEVTERCGKAANILGVELLDHLVIAPGRFASLRELGLMGSYAYRPFTT